MKKLKVKVFWVVFLLFSTFSFVILFSSTMADYLEKYDSISRTLNSFTRPAPNDKKKLPPNQDDRKIFLDFSVYTVILDEEGEYLEIVNNTNYEEYDEEKIKQVATSILENKDDRVFIGNLYIDSYSYAYTNNNTLIIMDNTNIRSTLINGFIRNILFFVLSEIVIVVITRLITKWITDPVKESFEKQKVFVADASHELKTPLSVIVASTDAYFNDKDDKWIHNIRNESERMNKLVTDLLDLAKTEREEGLVMSTNNLSTIVESSILPFESLFYDKKIKLKYDIESDINMECNEDAITELMGILIDNSIKHCSNKGKVIINLSKNNKQIILEVKNTGDPIKKEDEEKIFERFYKVDSSRNRNSNNYGLGLAIAKNIVEKHSGTIKAHSEDGFTSFKIIWNQK